MLASSTAPYIMGQTFASTGAYNPCLIAFMVATALAALGFLTLGKYAYSPPPRATARISARASAGE
jgi:hypothetical protein